MMLENTAGSPAGGAKAAAEPPIEAVAATVLTSAKAMERGAVRPTIAVGVLGITIGVMVHGVSGAVGALLGVLLVLGSGYLGLFVMRWTARSAPTMVFAAAMGTYVLKLGLLMLFALAFGHTTLFDRRVCGITMAAGIVVWAAGQAMGGRKAKVPTIIPASSTASSSTD